MLWGEVNLISPPSRLRVSPPQSQDTEGWKSSGGTPDNGDTRLCINFASRRINASLSARIIILFKEFPLSCNLRQNYVVIKFCRDQFGQFWVKRLANIFYPNLKQKGYKNNISVEMLSPTEMQTSSGRVSRCKKVFSGCLAIVQNVSHKKERITKAFLNLITDGALEQRYFFFLLYFSLTY